MKIVTMATLKGGAGKTLNLFNIAGILAETKRVLLIDIDPQCNLSLDCQIDVTNRNTYSIRDVFENKPLNQPDLSQIIVKEPIKDLKNLDIIPSSILLFKTEQRLSMRGDNTHILERFFLRHKGDLKKYDYIMIDTNPSMSIININAFYVSDDICLSSDISKNGFSGAELFCALWDEKREELEKEDNISALIICNNDRRSSLGKELFEYAEKTEFSKDILMKTVIPQSKKLKETELKHRPINLLYPKDPIADCYRKLVDELKEGGTL